MKETTAYFNLSMTVECPDCESETDLEEYSREDREWHDVFRKWVSNHEDPLGHSKKVVCLVCDKEFKVISIGR